MPDFLVCRDCHSLLLGGRQGRGNIFERGKMLINVGFSVLYGDRPLLIPPVGLCHDAAVDHAKPVVSPQVDE